MNDNGPGWNRDRQSFSSEPSGETMKTVLRNPQEKRTTVT